VLNPPFLPKFSRSSRSPAVAKGGTIYFPIWLAYATAVLEKEGHNVKLIDAPAEGMGEKEVMSVVKSFMPELVVIDTATASIYSDVNFLEKIKNESGSYGILVGTHPSALPEETIKISNKIDAIARGEYDYTVRDLAAELERGGKEFEKIDGLSFRKSGKIIHNKNRALIENLDEIPFVSKVYKKHLNIKNYFYSANLYPEITIISGRGCPFQCTYCLLPQTMNGRGYRKRGVDNLLAEFEYIKENFPEVKEIFVEDDTFTADPVRVDEFCRKKVEAGNKLLWSCNARADVKLETLQQMKKAGCRLLCVGVESGEQEILNNIKKGTNIEGIRQFMKDTKKAGILVHGCFMLGNKGDTKETIRKTVDFAIELEPDTAQFFPIMVYPGTEAYDWVKKEGFLVSEDFTKWLDEEGNHNCMVSRPDLSNKELVEECNKGRKRFYMRPKYILSKFIQIFTHPQEAPRIFKSTKTFLKHLTPGN